MKKTWMPITAGILDIVSGGIGLIIALLVLAGSVTFLIVGGGITGLVPETPLVLALLAGLAIPMAVVDIFAIVGGVCALKRKKWGWALTGSIAALFPSRPLGIAAIVFTVLAKNEFE